MSNLCEYQGVLFSESTPIMLRDVILDVIRRKVLVHVLTGDPLTGIVTPQLTSVGYITLLSNKPIPVFKSRCRYSLDGGVSTEPVTRSSMLSTERVLKINEVDSCQLLFQSYECKSSPLRYVSELAVSPYGDIKKSAKLVCDNPSMELFVPDDIDVVNICEFLFGKIHFLPGFFDEEFKLA